MEATESAQRGIFALPNELFLSIFSLIDTRSLVQHTPTCKHFHFLILRLLHQRLQVATSLAGHVLYLECHHPSARLTASEFFCTTLRTDGLQALLSDIDGQHDYVGQVQRAGSLYSRFKPQWREPDIREQAYKHPAGDVPGSRTYQGHAEAQAVAAAYLLPPDQRVTETVTVDAHDLFSQLTTLAYLGKREKTRGLLFSIQEVSEGTIRVWRDWLARQCEGKGWSDREPVMIHHDGAPGSPSGKGKARADSVTGYQEPTKDPSILWINSRHKNVGIKFRVKERQSQGANPILYSSDVEVAVSYEVEFDEVYVRTTHLLLRLEEAQQQIDNHSGKAIVFGSYAGLQEFDTAGDPRP